MENLVLYWVKTATVLTLVLPILYKLIVKLWWRPRSIESHFSKQGVRGPPYRFFIGNMSEIVQIMLKATSQPMPTFSHNILPRVFAFYHHWKKIYGATFLLWFGPTVRLTVSDPDLIREVFTSKSESYCKVKAYPLSKLIEGEGLLTLDGTKWAHRRKLISPIFHMENLKMLTPIVAGIATDMLNQWSSMSTSDEVEIEVSEWFKTLTENVITRLVFGDSSYEEGKAIVQLQSRQMSLAGELIQKLYIPGYRFFPTKINRTLWSLDKELRKQLLKLVDDRQASEPLSDDSNVKSYKDLLGMMIDAASQENPTVTISDIVEECKTFFFAGKQTTSNLLTWTTVLLAMHPNWQELARDEVLKVCGSRDAPTKDDMPKLRTLSMIINESLRLYSPVIATIRRSKEDVELGGYKIPRGIELLIPMLALHHDQTIWGADADEFNPGRYADGMTRAAKHPMAFIPFGLGPRNCIGQNLAVLQAKMALATILKRFSFRLAPRYQHAPTVLMLLHPQHGAPIIFKRLSS